MTLLVADSFLVDDGRVRGLELHRERFAGSCAARGVAADGFWAEAMIRLPRTGRWFPRMELAAGNELRLQLRPAPVTGGQVRALRHAGDPRACPGVKGPDLELLGELRTQAKATHGADEIVLSTAEGVLLEGAYSGLVWWEDGVLCVPPRELPVLPSVTVRLLRRIAAALGVPVVERARLLADLDGCETWLVSALHGIRPVAEWLRSSKDHPGGPAGPVPASDQVPEPSPARRAAAWQRALLAEAIPLPPAAPMPA